MAKRPLRILSVAGCDLPVPPVSYGGAERMHWEIIEGLAARGHAITLVAAPGSHISGRVVPYSLRSKRKAIRAWERLRLYAQLWRLTRWADVVDWQCGGYTYMFPPFWFPRIPLVITSYNAFPEIEIDFPYERFKDKVTFVALSRAQMLRTKQLGRWRVIYPGLSPQEYPVAERPAADYLLYLGRLIAGKGADIAIEVARATGHPLKIAGPVVPPHEDQGFFKSKVEPRIDGRDIQYLGVVPEKEKLALLAGAKAMLFPVTWEEGFGRNMIEALACGTPVIAFNRTTVPEVISDGVNGFVCNTAEEMAAAVKKLPGISRAVCRQTFEQRFSTPRTAAEYEALFFEVIEGWGKIK